VYDVRPSQQVSLTAILGRSVVDERGNGAPEDLAIAANHAGMLNLKWRSTFAPSTVLNQRVTFVAHSFRETNQGNQEIARASDGQILYAASVTRELRTISVDTGVQAQRLGALRLAALGPEPARVSALRRLQPGERLAGSTWIRSGFIHFIWKPSRDLTVAPGARLMDSTLLHRRAVSRWILSEWAFRDWTLRASAGVSHQFPEIDQTLVGGGLNRLKPERAMEVDAGFEHRLTKSTRLRGTLFRRDERDLLRDPSASAHLPRESFPDEPGIDRFANALAGSSNGVELLVQRSSSTGWSGWIAYAYGHTLYRDSQRAETYWGDFDQRHGISASGMYRPSERTTVALKFRAGTNFPIPGYLVARNDDLFAGTARNQLRLPLYARLDVRASRTFEHATRRFTLFVDVLNVLNRRNVAAASGSIDPITGKAIGFTRTLFPRLPSAGIVIDF
jgi:hypothetical protein